MAVITRGFGGRRHDDTDLPPGQYRTDDFSLSCPGDGTDSPRRFRRFGVILRTRRERTRSAHGDRLDRLVFLAGWHVGVRGELIVGRLAPSWSVLPFAALAGRAAEHPVDPTAETRKVGDAPAPERDMQVAGSSTTRTP
jgi:hypothetical protein